MSFLQMSVHSAILIAAVLIIRGLTINRLPKKTFLVLWGIVLVRLFVPFSFPFKLSVYTLFNNLTENAVSAANTAYNLSSEIALQPTPPTQLSEQIILPQIPWLLILWALGFIICALFFTISYIRCKRRFKDAALVESKAVEQWLSTVSCKRSIKVCQTEKISAPLTYGTLRPVILLPSNICWDNEKQLNYVLAHEYIHIKRCDTVLKLILITALCLHWFNPMVWVMFILANRDIELSCDEAVVHTFGEDARAMYARALIGMEEAKSSIMPLCNSFSKNAIEERITAIMKTRKTTLAAIIFALLLVFAVTVFFATSAAAAAYPSEGHTFGEYEREKLKDFQFDGYESMTVAEFQEKAWLLKDTSDYKEVLEKISQNNKFYDMRSSNTYSKFLFYTLEPLTAEQWQTRSFNGFVQAPTDYSASEPAVLEYSISLTIKNAQGLTVNDYNKAQNAAISTMHEFLTAQSISQLEDEESTKALINAEIAGLKEKWDTSALEININYGYKPLEALSSEIMNEISASLDESIKRYAPYGITYKLNELNGQAKLYWNNKEIAGIYDNKEGMWISNSASADGYPEDVKVLVTVYTNGKLSGLRESTDEEQGSFISHSPDNSLLEPRQYPNAEKEDYRSLFALKTPGYEKMSVKEFNSALLDWANADFDRTQRIQLDVLRHDYIVNLQQDERLFAELTAALSSNENAQAVKSYQTGKPEEDPWCGNYQLNKQVSDVDMSAWCSLWYQFPYHIYDKDKLTVAERDSCISGFLNDVNSFWENTSLEELLLMTKQDVVSFMKSSATKHSTELIAINIDESQVQFEHMDERDKNE